MYLVRRNSLFQGGSVSIEEALFLIRRKCVSGKEQFILVWLKVCFL